MPRRRSSAHRSGSMPVSARTSVDLPWSTCPAVAHAPLGSRAALARTRGEHRSNAASVARRRHRRAGRAGQRPARRRPRRTHRTASPGPQRRAASLGQGAPPQLGSAHPGAPPPPTAPVAGPRPASTPAPASRSASALGARVAALRGRRAAQRPPAVAAAVQRGLQRGQGQLVHPQRPGQRMPAQRVDQRRPGRAAGPACGPPSSLSPLAVTSVGARRAAQVVGVGLVGQQRVRAQQAASRCRRPAGRVRGRPARSTRDRRSEALDHGSCDGCTLSTNAGVGADRRARSRPARSGWWCPPRGAGHRCDCSRSGSRNPSPISISSPRLTMISRPAASAVVASTSAAAPLLTTCTAPAAGHRPARAAERDRAPRADRAARCQVELDVACSRPRPRSASTRGGATAAPGRGWCARPRRSR